MKLDLLEYKANVFSQNGEDGIIEKIFSLIGTSNKVCCEFGAWDGVHFCNIRNLIVNKGWEGVLIEGDQTRYHQISNNYPGCKIHAINAFVDSQENRLSALLSRHTNIKELNIDFLSVDIDGLDYEILETLDIDPNVICIEVNAGHDPNNSHKINRKTAVNNIGQSLHIFTAIAGMKGYGLLCYSGNAFFVKNHLLEAKGIEPLTNEEAYRNFLRHLTHKEKEWLYLVNTGDVPPYYNFNNPLLRKEQLGFTDAQVTEIKKALPGSNSLLTRLNRRLGSLKRFF